VNATGDSTATWLGEGLTVAFREQFRRAGWQLVPESRVHRAMREYPTPEAAARAAGAALLIAGRTDSVAGHVRLRAVAVSPGTARPVVTAEVIVQPNRLLDAELALVGNLIGQLRPDLSPDSLVVALRRGTSDDAAYRFLLQGWYLWDRRYTLPDMLQAATRFDSALAHDPVYADARAVELDSTSRVALSVLGAVETFHDSMAARRLLERAVALDPDRADTYFLLGLHYSFRGEYARAERSFLRATELEPQAPFQYSRLVGAQVCQGAYDRALVSVARWRAAATRPDLRAAIDYREASLLLALDRWREAVPLLREVLRDSPDLVVALGRAQSTADVQDVLQRDASRSALVGGAAALTGQRRGLTGAHLAMRSGLRDEAIRMLLEARDGGDVTLPMACGDPLLQPLMKVPEVAQAMRLAQSP
jgi:tetratricopeptide (TPR) repeat protein